MNYIEFRNMTAFGKKKKVKCIDPDNPVEHVEACRFADWLYSAKENGVIVEYAHLINELKLDRRNGDVPNFGYLTTMKAEGWRKGVPDYLIVTKNKIIFLEMKRKKGNNATDEQKQWIESINSAGGIAVVCKGAAAAIKYMEEII